MRLHLVGATHIFQTTQSVSVGVFDLVNHRKAPSVNLPLDLKDVCGFPLSHQSPHRRWGGGRLNLSMLVFKHRAFCVMTTQIKLDLIHIVTKGEKRVNLYETATFSFYQS